MIENDVDLIDKVKASFSIPGEIILQKYLDAWAEWVDVSPPEIQHIKMKVDFCIVNRHPGEGILPYVTLTGTCGPIGYGFQGVLS